MTIGIAMVSAASVVSVVVETPQQSMTLSLWACFATLAEFGRLSCLDVRAKHFWALFPPGVVQDEYDTFVYNISRTFSSAGINHVVVDNDYTLRFWVAQPNSRELLRTLNGGPLTSIHF